MYYMQRNTNKIIKNAYILGSVPPVIENSENNQGQGILKFISNFFINECWKKVRF